MRLKDIQEGRVVQPDADKHKELVAEEEEDIDIGDESEGEGKTEIVSKKRELVIPLEEEDFDPSTFNPFDKKARKREEELEKPLKPRKLLHIKKK